MMKRLYVLAVSVLLLASCTAQQPKPAVTTPPPSPSAEYIPDSHEGHGAVAWNEIYKRGFLRATEVGTVFPWQVSSGSPKGWQVHATSADGRIEGVFVVAGGFSKSAAYACARYLEEQIRKRADTLLSHLRAPSTCE